MSEEETEEEAADPQPQAPEVDLDSMIMEILTSGESGFYCIEYHWHDTIDVGFGYQSVRIKTPPLIKPEAQDLDEKWK